MAEIELVVRLDQETLQDLYDSRYVSPHIKEVFKSANPLPKGHGRLIDERQINECKQVGLIIQDDAVTRCLVTDAPTIIEAERQSLKQIRMNRQMRRNDADSN